MAKKENDRDRYWYVKIVVFIPIPSALGRYLRDNTNLTIVDTRKGPA